MKKTLLLFGALVLLLVVAFPPVVATSRHGQTSMGNRFLFALPVGDSYVDFRIDYARYAATALGVLAVTGVGALAFRRS